MNQILVRMKKKKFGSKMKVGDSIFLDKSVAQKSVATFFYRNSSFSSGEQSFFLVCFVKS
jgi:hypothetical protein